MSPFDFSSLPKITGHRGAKGSAPENTMASFTRAAQLGVRFVEFDVNLAGGGDIVVFHDYELDRCTNGTGRLVDYPYSALSSLDAGSHFSCEFQRETIPLFSDLIPRLQQLGIGANVEVKSLPGNEAETVAGVVDAIRHGWPSSLPLLMSSFNESVIALLRDQLPEVSRGWLIEAVPENWWEKLREFDAVSLHCEDEPLSKELMQQVLAKQIPVLVYTVNEPERARQLLEWGAASVISDYPERMLDS